jgi:hypothetical protein
MRPMRGLGNIQQQALRRVARVRADAKTVARSLAEGTNCDYAEHAAGLAIRRLSSSRSQNADDLVLAITDELSGCDACQQFCTVTRDSAATDPRKADGAERRITALDGATSGTEEPFRFRCELHARRHWTHDVFGEPDRRAAYVGWPGEIAESPCGLSGAV